MRSTVCVAAALAAVTLAACNDSSGPANTGSLAVTVTAPSGVTPAVAVSGPNAYSTTVTATGTLSNIKIGTYTLVADTVSVADSVVGATINTGVVTGSPATVVAHQTAQASVAYTQTGRRGGLWVANNDQGFNVTEFAAAQLRATAAVTQADSLAGIPQSAGLALDASGNLWVSSYGLDTIRMYTLAQRNAGGDQTPTIKIVSPSLLDPEQIAFDSHGTLWIADYYNGLVGFTSSQLATSGTVTAAYVITDTTVQNAGTYAVAFDGAGNAWVAAYIAHHLSEYAPAALTASGSPVPAVVIDPTNNSLYYPAALAFDGAGDLWVANGGNPTVVEYTPSQLSAGGSPTPNATVTLTNGPNGPAPFGLAFDNRGTLWVSDDDNSAIVGISAAELASGTGTPIVLSATGKSIGGPEQIVFDPYATATAPAAASRVPRSTPRHALNFNVRVNRPTPY